MSEHQRIWLEPVGAPDRCWCSDNQWDEDGVEYVLASDAAATIKGLEEQIAALMAERTSLIETKREQIERLTRERDNAQARQQRCAIGWADALNEAEAAEAERDALREKAQALLDHWDERDGPEKRGSFEGVEYWSPAGRMVDTQVIADLRKSLEPKP